MLVANPGHTPYSFTSKTSKIQSSNQTNKSSSNKNSNDALTNSLSSSILLNQQKPSTSSTLLATTSTTAIASTSSLRDKPSTSFDVIKTHSSSLKYNDVINSISVRINRGTELIKQTVNKALFSKITPAFGGLLTVPPTSIHKSPDRNTKSTDSLKLEMCHFKPIKTVPTTPNKKTKIIIRTPKAKRAQKIDFPRSLPIKSAVSLLLSSQNSAFYLVKRSKDIRYTNIQPTTTNQTNSTTVSSKDNDKKLKRTDTINLLPNKTCPINTTTCQRLKRNRNESHSPSSSSSTTANTIDAKRICLDNNNTRTTRTTRKSSNLTNNSSSTNTNIITDSITIANNNGNNRKRDDNDDKPNGLILENGQRRSIRIRNKKLKNDLNLNDTYTINNINNNTNNCNLKNFKTITNNINSNVNLKTNSTLFHIMTRNKSIFNVQKKSEPIIEIKHSYRKCVKKSSPNDNKMNNSNNNNNINVNRNNENKNSKTKTKKKKQTNNNNTNKRKNNKSNNTRILTAKSKLSLLENEKTNDKQQKQIILSNNDRRRTRQQNQQNKKSPTTTTATSSSLKSSSSSLSTDKKNSRKSNRITSNNNTVTTRGESVRNLRPRVQK